ncbi:O-antigen ligase family protein [Arenimonas composti]|uniref:O-antigen ligase-related domain-containing protein n=1 Tax=Arenimonas composti TR7-09 = DSM 18010 TaxID=1121013 RepID=A0A091BX03_9GAMM|nr:O-antigen ligase family protein [Arenimonas composti]KFN48865.1 hypothetical protein P873_13005 [Arenimonas composti TR7-09 = DSM 18010]
MPAADSRNLHATLSLLLLLACLVLGGGQGTLGDTFCQLLALLLIGVVVWRHVQSPAARLPAIAWLVAPLLALPLLQLLPLPEGLWNAVPVRAALGEDLAAAGVESPLHRISLSPVATERALYWLLPAVALYLATLQMDQRRRNALLIVLVAVAVVSVVLGIAQLGAGPDSLLRPYAITNESEAVGLFANRNHFAGLLAVALPVVVIGTALLREAHIESGRSRGGVDVAVGAGVVILLILGIAMARSRAGLLMGMIAFIASGIVVTMLSRQRGGRRWLLLAIAAGLVLSIQFALIGILKRLERDPLDDARLLYLPAVLEVADEHLPWGAGLGSFRRAFEASDPAFGSSFVNHAHDDYIELWLDGGWPAAAVVLVSAAGVVVWLLRRRRLLAAGEGRDPRVRALARAAGISLLLLGVHSLVDYPLRTTAMLATAGVLAGIALMPPRRGREGNSQGAPSHT